MLAKSRQFKCAQGFVHLLFYLLAMVGKVMEFMPPSGRAVYGNGQELLPVRALSPLMRMRVYRRRWTSWDLSRTVGTRHLTPARRPSPWSSFSE
jgi:hypothetical protein